MSVIKTKLKAISSRDTVRTERPRYLVSDPTGDQLTQAITTGDPTPIVEMQARQLTGEELISYITFDIRWKLSSDM